MCILQGPGWKTNPGVFFSSGLVSRNDGGVTGGQVTGGQVVPGAAAGNLYMLQCWYKRSVVCSPLLLEHLTCCSNLGSTAFKLT